MLFYVICSTCVNFSFLYMIFSCKFLIFVFLIFLKLLLYPAFRLKEFFPLSNILLFCCMLTDREELVDWFALYGSIRQSLFLFNTCTLYWWYLNFEFKFLYVILYIQDLFVHFLFCFISTARAQNQDIPPLSATGMLSSAFSGFF